MLDSLNRFKISKIIAKQSDRYLKVDQTQTDYILNLMKYDYWYERKTNLPFSKKSNIQTLLFINNLSRIYPGILMNKNSTQEDVIIIKSNSKKQCLYKNTTIIPEDDVCESAERTFKRDGNPDYYADLISANGELKSFQVTFDFIKLMNQISFMFQAKPKDDIDFFAFCNQKSDGEKIKMFTLSTLNKDKLHIFNKIRKWYLDYNQFNAEMSYKYNLNLSNHQNGYFVNEDAEKEEDKKNIPTTIYIPMWCLFNTIGWDCKNINNKIIRNIPLCDGIIFSVHNANDSDLISYRQILTDLFIKRISNFIDKEISKFNLGCNDFDRRIEKIQEKIDKTNNTNDKIILEAKLKEFIKAKQTFKNRMKDLVFEFINLTTSNTQTELKQELQNEFLKSYNKDEAITTKNKTK